MEDQQTTCYLVAPEPPDEIQRLQALRNLNLLDTAREDRFDDIVGLAARLFRAPICYVALVDSGRQWFKARVGLTESETSRQVSFCSHTILQSVPLVIPDTLADPNYAQNPLVLEDPFIRFYAGQSLRDETGYRVGTLCVADREPRIFGGDEIELLRRLAALVERELTLRDVIRLQEEMLGLQNIIVESQKEMSRLHTTVKAERDKSDALLLNILPTQIATELKASGKVDARYFDDAFVMFTDFTEFTRLSADHTPAVVVKDLNECFSAFDEITIRNGVEKLKTLGDGYLCVAGVPQPSATAAVDLARTALEIRDLIAERRRAFAARGIEYWNIRIGLHRGPLIAGVVGLKKFAFDVWGDTVNIASRLESASVAGRINISAEYRCALPESAVCEARGAIPVKSKGPMEMYFLESLG